MSWIPLHWAKYKIRETAGLGDKYNLPFCIFFLYLFLYHSSCFKDQFTVLISKFDMKFKDFTDSGQLKIRLMSHCFVAVVLPSQVFLILVRERVGGFKEDLQ